MASVPESTIVPVPEPVTVTLPPEVAAITPVGTASVTVIVPLPASTSEIDRPVSAIPVSSLVAQPEAGRLLTGASLTAVTLTVTRAVSVTPPDVTV